MSFQVGAVLALKDTFSATVQGIKKENSRFRVDIEKTRKALEKTFEKKREIRIENSVATKAIRTTLKALEPLNERITTVVAYKDMIKGHITATTNKLKVLGSMVVSPVIKVKDFATNTINGIKSAIGTIPLAVTAALAAISTLGASKALSSGAMLEQQQISMEHYIGIQNKGMSADEVRKTRDNYLNELRTNANITPFTTEEVVAAGTRALNVAGGNTKSAMNIVKVAEDMAALTPGKTLEQAMEALADAKVGEFERLKEFGFKVNAETFKGFVGKGKNDDLTDAETLKAFDILTSTKLKPFFEGGAAKLSTSASGLWSTITGTISSKLQDTGLKVLEQLKPVMQKVITWLNEFSPVMDQWGAKIGSGIGTALGYFGQFAGWINQYMPTIRGVIGSVSNWISEKFSWISGKAGFLKDMFSSAWSGIQDVMAVSWKVLKPVFDLIAAGVRILFDVFQLTFPYIREIVTSVWDDVKPILETLGDALGWVADKAGKIAEWLGKTVDEHNAANSSGRPSVDGSHANGLSYVPKDGYIAELHKGERVLTAQENAQYSNYKSNVSNANSNKTVNIYINGVSMSPDEMVEAIVPKLELALANM